MRVISIPASGTFELIKKYHIHAFPHPRSYDFSGMVTFRKTGGIMECLYTVQKTVIIDVSNLNWKDSVDYLDTKIIERIEGYIEGRDNKFGFEKPIFMFWVLNEKKELLHKPRPIQVYNNHVYFLYDEICSGKELVMIDSKKITQKKAGFSEQLKMEFKNIESGELSDTEKERLVKGRIGQSEFKQKLKSMGIKCAICSIDVEDFLIASHIKPWKDCNSNERLDINNGLLLCPNHDWLFDKGYISFEENGNIVFNLYSARMITANMGIGEYVKISLNDQQKKYMAWHREKYFKY